MDKGSVYMATVTAKTDTGKVMITVKSSSYVPSSVNDIDMPVYEYEDANLYYASESEISGVGFDFRVEKSWLTANGYSFDDIVLMHYNEESGEDGKNTPTGGTRNLNNKFFIAKYKLEL